MRASSRRRTCLIDGPLIADFVRHLLPQGEKGRDYALRASAPSIIATAFVHAIHRDERAEARALLLAEQHLVEHVEPVERDAGPAVLALLHLIEERLAAADLVDHVLDVFGARSRRQLRQRIAQILQRGALAVGRLAELLRRRHEVAIVVDGVADHRIELRMRLRRHARTIAADEAPQRFGILRVRRRHQRQQQLERDRHVGLRRLAGMDVPDRIGELLLGVLPRKAVEELLVVVDVARDHVEIQPLRRLRLAVHEQRQRFRRGVAQPFVDGEPVALRLRNLLALLVEEELVVEAFRRRAAERRGRSGPTASPSRSGPCRPSRSRRRARTSASPSRPSTGTSHCRR